MFDSPAGGPESAKTGNRFQSGNEKLSTRFAREEAQDAWAETKSVSLAEMESTIHPQAQSGVSQVGNPGTDRHVRLNYSATNGLVRLERRMGQRRD